MKQAIQQAVKWLWTRNKDTGMQKTNWTTNSPPIHQKQQVPELLWWARLSFFKVHALKCSYPAGTSQHPDHVLQHLRWELGNISSQLWQRENWVQLHKQQPFVSTCRTGSVLGQIMHQYSIEVQQAENQFRNFLDTDSVSSSKGLDPSKHHAIQECPLW